MKRLLPLVSTIAALAAAASFTYPSLSAQTRATATNVPVIPHEAVPDFFKPPSATTFPPDSWQVRLAQPATVILVAEQAGGIVGYLYADTAPAMETTSTYERPRFLSLIHI